MFLTTRSLLPRIEGNQHRKEWLQQRVSHGISWEGKPWARSARWQSGCQAKGNALGSAKAKGMETHRHAVCYCISSYGYRLLMKREEEVANQKVRQD